MAPNPLAQRLRAATDLWRDGPDARSLRVMLGTRLENQVHHALTNLGRELLGLLHDDSIFSKIRIPIKPGAVQYGSLRIYIRLRKSCYRLTAKVSTANDFQREGGGILLLEPGELQHACPG